MSMTVFRFLNMLLRVLRLFAELVSWTRCPALDVLPIVGTNGLPCGQGLHGHALQAFALPDCTLFYGRNVDKVA